MLQEQFKDIFRSLWHPAQSDPLKAQAIRQVASGFAATIVDLLFFKIGLIFGVNVLIAAFFSASLATVVNFLITRYYVFGHVSEQKIRALAQFALYIPAVLVSMGLTQLILLVFNIWIGFDPMLVKIAAIPVVYIWTVICGKYIIFKRNPPIS
jgi:putative flippase GtrA